MLLQPSSRVTAVSLLGLLALLGIWQQRPSERHSLEEYIILPDTPVHILTTYKSQHSEEALRVACLSGGCNDRTFLVGYYSCPLQAGNRLHHFTNAFVWALVTNRTLLWKYYDTATCLAQGSNHDLAICASANKEQDCARVLIRSSWIPSYDSWAHKLNLGQATLVPYAKTKIHLKGRLKLHQNETDKNNGLSIDIITDKVIDTGQLLGRDADVIASMHGREQLLQTAQARTLAERLFSKGHRYLYGMLLDEAFQFHDSIQPSLQTLEAMKSTATIALHSRHTSQLDKGENITREQKCLQQVLANFSRPCAVILLSDRQRTLELLNDFVTSLNCTPMFANHDDGISFRVDHGPYSGAGFFQDLALASSAVHAFIGHRQRSSSMLLEEMIVYKRSRYVNLSPLVECYLPSMKHFRMARVHKGKSKVHSTMPN